MSPACCVAVLDVLLMRPRTRRFRRRQSTCLLPFSVKCGQDHFHSPAPSPGVWMLRAEDNLVDSHAYIVFD